MPEAGGLSDRALAFAAALEKPKTTRTWKPLPHQIPPPGDWLGWLLMAGRGAGKTEACARFVTDHVNGPPCMPGPIPHWMAIIAPTLGDAATACFAGPSGIRHFAPEANMSSKVGGLLVTWPNGSQAKMYGARDPDDVERLRAGGNTCISYDTLVTVYRGQIPIQDVTTNDWVLTRRGYRRVLATWDNGVRDVWEVELTDGRKLRATPDHKVLTTHGWVNVENLRVGSILVCQPSSARNVAVLPLSGVHDHVRSTVNVRVSSAAPHSSAMSKVKPELAHVSVRTVKPCGYATRVFDLTVDEQHEFIAANIYVHNCLAWCEELAAWRYLQDAFDQLRFGLRIGSKPRWIASTTPKPRPLIKKLVKGEIRGVALTHATMYENPHLPEHIKDALEEAYTGTSIGSQELYGKLVEQDSNALWTRETLERTRRVVAPPLKTIEVGVDPSGGAGEQGIVVVGRADLPDPSVPETQKQRLLKHGFVLADATVHMKPEGWARTAVNAAVDWEADRIVVETNFGGDQATALVVNACDHMGVHIPVRTVHASRGKRPRAEPVSAMSAQDRWHLVGRFDELEDQMCTWTTDSDWSPDRIDAMVWPAWSMKLVSTLFHSVGTFGGGQMVRRTLGRRRPQ